MKVRVPKEYKALPKKQKEIVCDYLKEVAIEEALKSYNRDLGIALEQFMMMTCINLNRYRGFGEKRCRQFLAAFRRIFQENLNYVKKGCQNEKLQAEVEQIFKKGGWPHDMFTDITGELNPDYKNKCEGAKSE